RAKLDPVPLHTAARVRHPANFELAFTLGMWHEYRNDGRKLAQFAAACALRPDSPTVWTLLGIALSDSGDSAGAAAAYREAIRRDFKFVPAHYNLGILLFDVLGDAPGAQAEWDAAVRLDPDSALVHYNRGRVLHARGDFTGALAAAELAVKYDPNLAQA